MNTFVWISQTQMLLKRINYENRKCEGFIQMRTSLRDQHPWRVSELEFVYVIFKMACGATWTAIIMNIVGVEACNGLINGSTMIMAEKY